MLNRPRGRPFLALVGLVVSRALLTPERRERGCGRVFSGFLGIVAARGWSAVVGMGNDLDALHGQRVAKHSFRCAKVGTHLGTVPTFWFQAVSQVGSED